MLKYFILSFLAFTPLIFADFRGFEYWLFTRHIQQDKSPYTFYYSGDVRFDCKENQVYHYRMSENFLYSAKPSLDLEAHYSYIYNKSPGTCRFINTSRFELEINPYFSVNALSFRFRNRMEFIKRHKEDGRQYVFRQKTGLNFAIKNIPYLTSCGMNNEFFFDFKRDRVTQNRFVPLEVSFKFYSTELDVFIMMRDFYSFNFNRWLKSFVAGTEIRF